MSEQEVWSYPCPRCRGVANVVGGFNEIEYIQYAACGYYGDHFEQDGIVYDIEVATKGGRRAMDEDAYRRRISEIASDRGDA